jgi:hypothetical protein
MPTSVFFNNYNSTAEQRLYNDLINETIQIYGIDSMYIPRSTESAVDLIFGDDPTKSFEAAYPVEVYVKNVDNFEGQELFSKFGLEIQHQIRFLMTTDAFKRRVPSTYSRPREGDLLWLTNFQALFEIKFVNQQHFFYAFGNKNFYGFELVCERFRYSNETVQTGITEIDDAADSVISTYEFNMVSEGTGTYELGEQVFQGASLSTATATATIVSWNLPTSVLELKTIQGVFLAQQPIIGANSGANYILYSYDGLNNTNNLLDNNSELGILADEILDFSEHNPFGEPIQVPAPNDNTQFINDSEQDTTMYNDSGQQVNFPIGNKKPKPQI